MYEGVIETKRLFKDPARDMLLIGSLTAVAVLSGIFDVSTARTMAAVILGSIVIGIGVVIWAEGR